ncbi:hypothetical protein JC525_08920 [Alteromonas sp. IB21]|uniref:hypothetical protein n=1 Tax=Alteromonas sp. IB21 TaxID=2779369 RepID=UPI0018E6DE34|nr:hypothetical protein [Alteromonas sp. IB21]MBJ2129057.1 hypothetical protein [Alteromonas sp. IB21]
MTTTTFTYRNEEWVEAEPQEGERYKIVTDKGDKGQRIIEGVKSTPVEDKRITPKSFLNRFTTAEYVAIDLASIDNPQGTQQSREQAAMLRLFLAKVNSARFIDLDDDEAIDGINSLVQFELLTSVRAFEILNDEVKEKEGI